jgi:hypothetical protein
VRNDGGNFSESDQTLRMKFGILVPPHNNSFAFDGAALLGINSIEGKSVISGQTSTLSMEGGTEFGLDLRLEYFLNDKLTLVPRVRWYSFSWGMSQLRNGVRVLPNPASDYGHEEFEIGFGENFRTGGILIVGGLSWQRIVLSSEYKSTGSVTKTTVTSNDLPKINLGAEIQVASWLAARIGYFDRMTYTETESITSSGKTTITSSSEPPWYGDPNGLSAAQQRLTIGLGFRVEQLQCDVTLGEGYFLNGPWPLSGTAQQMFGAISMSYHF